jgi:hypothetical protein
MNDVPRPRRTKRQHTRWTTQDEAFAAAPQGATADVLRYIAQAPSTCDGVEAAFGGLHQSISASVNHLMRKGFIRPCGYGVTRSGRRAVMWAAVTSGTTDAVHIKPVANDLVERLRACASVLLRDLQRDDIVTFALLVEAAKEIERLRKVQAFAARRVAQLTPIRGVNE